MIIFDQRGQHVQYQYNAAGDINFGTVQNKMEAIGQLEKLQSELTRAADAGALDEDLAVDVESQIKKAILQAKKPEPDKKTIMDRLKDAKTLIEGVTSLGGMVQGLAKAAEMVQQFF
jgi:hypothetical protein